MYHIAAIEQGEKRPLSEDFFIEARKDSPPSVKIIRPGRDAKVILLKKSPWRSAPRTISD